MATPAFRGLRRDIALALSGGRERTLYETAKAVGRRSGDIQRVVRQMHEEGMLRADSSEPTQGTLYWLSDDWAEALSEEVADGAMPGVLAQHQRLLVVVATDVGQMYRMLGRQDLAGVVAWAAELGGDGQWLLALDPKTRKAQADRLVAALQAASFSCATLRVEDVLDHAALRQLSVAVADAVQSG